MSLSCTARAASCIAMRLPPLSRLVGEMLQDGSKVVLDLSGVSAMDSAGIGELALLQTWAQERNAELKCAGANELVRTLLDLTNLDSVLEVHPTLEAALESFRGDAGCAPTVKLKMQCNTRREQSLALLPFVFWENAGGGARTPVAFDLSIFALEAVAAFALQGDRFRHFQEGAGGVGEVGVFAVDEAQLALQLQFANWDADEFSAGDFVFDADFRQRKRLRFPSPRIA